MMAMATHAHLWDEERLKYVVAARKTFRKAIRTNPKDENGISNALCEGTRDKHRAPNWLGTYIASGQSGK